MPDTTSQPYGASDNFVTVARALDGKRLNKTIYADGHTIPYDNAYYYKFTNLIVSSLQDLFATVKPLVNPTQANRCIIRGIAKDDSITRQRRLFKNEEATIIEQRQNWFALDVDNYSEATGNLKEDAKQVLLALALHGIECFAIPSASYKVKSGICLRLFLWNDEPITCHTLKRYFHSYGGKCGVVDLAMFHPIQPIYIARPTFIGMRDPCNETIAWISGNDQTTHITEQEDISFHGRIEEQYTKQQATRMRDRVFRDLPMVDENRHFALYNSSIWIAKLCWQGHFDLDEMKDELEGITLMWGGNNKKDRATIEDAFRDGYKAMEGSNSDQF